MSTKQKVLLIGLAVLLVVLFAVAVGVGGRRVQGDPAKPGSLVEWLGKIGGKKSAVDPATVTADCDKKGEAYTFTGTCTLTVADPGGMKTLILRSQKEFTVSAPAPGDADFRIEDTVETSPGPDAVVKVAVDSETQVELGCPGPIGSACAVTVAAE
jgi:hypothetical protein